LTAPQAIIDIIATRMHSNY